MTPSSRSRGYSSWLCWTHRNRAVIPRRVRRRLWLPLHEREGDSASKRKKGNLCHSSGQLGTSPRRTLTPEATCLIRLLMNDLSQILTSSLTTSSFLEALCSTVWKDRWDRSSTRPRPTQDWTP